MLTNYGTYMYIWNVVKRAPILSNLDQNKCKHFFNVYEENGIFKKLHHSWAIIIKLEQFSKQWG